MQWKYVVLQYLVLGPGLGLEPQVLVNITDFRSVLPLVALMVPLQLLYSSLFHQKRQHSMRRK